MSILSTYLQIFCYYFFDQAWLVLGITVVLTLLLSHFSLEISLSYEPGFLQTLFSVLISFTMMILIFRNQTGNLLVYRRYLPLIPLLNWLVPLFYYILRNLYDRGPRFVGFRPYFIKAGFLFLAFYLLILADKLFLRPLLPPYGGTLPDHPNLIPFWTTAANIEAYIYHRTALWPLLAYIIKNILLFVPFGFYLQLSHRKIAMPFRLFLLAVFPLVMEGVQYITKRGRCDVDDFFYAILGGILGLAASVILNHVYLAINGEPFLKERRNYSFLRNLH